jgi:outer membrane receptor protein involved in Fe transport
MKTTDTTSARFRQIALAASLLLPNLMLAQEPAAPKDAAPTQLEAFSVTGSRIQRLDAEGPQPVLAFTSADITTSGFTNLSDFLQSQSFNSGGVGNMLQTSTSGVGVAFSRGASSLNPRGLGAGNFLVLVNGRRTATYANPDSNGTTVFDFKSVPLEAIDRIEYLKDGASAIYGSDAITGVLNIQLKKHYSGVNVDIEAAGAVNGPTAFTRSANVLAGGNDRDTSILVDVSWSKQNPTSINQYSRSKTGNYLYLGAVKGSDTESTQSFPANINLSAAQAKAAGLATGAGYYGITGGQPTSNPTLASFSFLGAATAITDTNRIDLNAQGMIPKQEDWNGLVYMTHDISDRLQAFAQVIASDAKTHYLYAPVSARETSVSVSQIFETAIPNNAQNGLPVPSLIIPAANPYNPFGQNLTSYMMRADPSKPRMFDVDSTAVTLLAGLKGKLFAEWNWETGFSYGQDIFSSVQSNVWRADDLQNALNGTLTGAVGQYFNPFGPSSQTLVNTLYIKSTNSYKGYGYDGDFTVSGPLFAMPALLGLPAPGDAALAAGGEWHQDKVDAAPDSTNLVGTSNGSPFVGQRTVVSEYVELDLPVLKKYLELQGAARHEHYSDFGGTTKAKFAATSQVASFLKLRASYSQSFKAPDLAQLDGGGTSFSAATTDPLNPAVPSQRYLQVSSANPNLKPEQGKIYYWGAILDLGKVVKNLSFTVDYTNITISNAIIPASSFTPAQLFTYYPNLVVRNANTNQISYFNLTPFNGAAYYYRGYDLGLQYNLRKTPVGDFLFQTQATRILYLAYNAGQGIINYTGRYGFGGEVERWTGTSSIGWNLKDWSATVAAVYKGSVLADANGTVAANTAWGVNPIALFNATFGKANIFGIKATVGVNNLLNTQPPANGVIAPSAGFDLASYGQWAAGRTLFVKLERKF